MMRVHRKVLLPMTLSGSVLLLFVYLDPRPSTPEVVNEGDTCTNLYKIKYRICTKKRL